MSSAKAGGRSALKPTPEELNAILEEVRQRPPTNPRPVFTYSFSELSAELQSYVTISDEAFSKVELASDTDLPAAARRVLHTVFNDHLHMCRMPIEFFRDGQPEFVLTHEHLASLRKAVEAIHDAKRHLARFQETAPERAAELIEHECIFDAGTDVVEPAEALSELARTLRRFIPDPRRIVARHESTLLESLLLGVFVRTDEPYRKFAGFAVAVNEHLLSPLEASTRARPFPLPIGFPGLASKSKSPDPNYQTRSRAKAVMYRLRKLGHREEEFLRVRRGLQLAESE